MFKYELELFPKSPGVYFWYCSKQGLELLGIDPNKLTIKGNKYLIYIGKDNNSLRSRLKWHWDSKVSMNQKIIDHNQFMLSTYRHSLGSLLFEYNEGEKLDRFMIEHLEVEFIITNNKQETIDVEDKFIKSTPYLPLNLKGNKNKDEFHKFLSKQRKNFKINTIKHLAIQP